MAKKESSRKKKRIIQLRSTGVTASGRPTGYFVTTTKPKNASNPKNAAKLKLKKFDPRAFVQKGKGSQMQGPGAHVEFVEEKIKS